MKPQIRKNTNSLRTLICIFLISMIFAVLSGCGSGGGGGGSGSQVVDPGSGGTGGGGNTGGGGTGGGGGSSSPGVVSTDPGNGDTAIERDTVVSVTFSDGMDEATINDTSFALGDSNGNTVTGVVSFDTVSKIAALTPAAVLGILRTYTATLTADITHSGGTPITAMNWSFQTRDGAWNTAVQIETDTTVGANPHVVFDATGNAIAVWISGGTDVVANSYTAATNSWGTAVVLDSWNSGLSDLQVAMDNNGTAIAVWAKSQGSARNIRASRYNGISWQADVGLEPNGGVAQSPQVAMDAAGNAIVVWLQPSSGFDSIWYNRYDAGSDSWGTATLLEAADTVAYAPQLAMNESGDAIAAWAQDNGSGNNAIYAAHYTSGAGWSAANAIGAGSSNGFTAQIAMDQDGHAVAVWYQVAATTPYYVYSIWANRYDGSAWDTAAEIETSVNTNVTPQIAFDAQGNGMAVWKSSTGRLRYNTCSATTGCGTANNVETGSDPAFIPQLAVDAEGHALVVWRQLSNATFSVWASRYQFGNGWGTPELLELDDTYAAASPDVAIDQNGNAFAIWIQNDGISDSTWVSRFE